MKLFDIPPEVFIEILDFVKGDAFLYDTLMNVSNSMRNYINNYVTPMIRNRMIYRYINSCGLDHDKIVFHRKYVGGLNCTKCFIEKKMFI